MLEFHLHGLRERATDALCVLAFKTGTNRAPPATVTLEEVAEATSADIVLLRPRFPTSVSHVRGECYMAPEAELLTATRRGVWH